MFRPITRSLSRLNEQNYVFSPEITSSQVLLASTNFAMPSGQLPPRTRPSREFSRPQNYPSWPNDNIFERPHDAVHLIKTATHADLLQAGNPTYGSLYDGFMGMKARYEELRASYDKLTDTVKTTIDSSGPTASSSAAPQFALVSEAPKFKHEEYPKIRFVMARHYNDFQKEKMNSAAILNPVLGQKKRGGTRLANNNENVATDYIEHEDGTIVVGDTAKSIRFHARAVFIEMDKIPSIKLPTSWSHAGITERKFFIREMYSKYPYLGLCEDDWKALYLASRTLSTFHEYRRRQAKKATIVKSEVKTEKIEPQIKIEPKANAGPRLGATDTVVAADGDDIYYYGPNSAPPTPNPKRKMPSSSTAAQTPSKRPRSSTNVVYDLTGDLDGEVVNSSTATSVPPTSSPSSSTLSDPPSSAPTSPASLPSPKSSMAPKPKPRPTPRTKPTAQQVAVVAMARAEDCPPTETVVPTMSVDPEDLPQANSSPASLTETPDATTKVAPTITEARTEDSATPTISVENPFASLFGPAMGPSGRLKSLGEMSGKVTQKGEKGAMTKEASNASAKAPTASESTARSKIFGPGAKKVTNSSSAKNLYYIEFLQSSDPITPAAFETHWNGLDKDTIKKYMQLSKSQK